MKIWLFLTIFLGFASFSTSSVSSKAGSWFDGAGSKVENAFAHDKMCKHAGRSKAKQDTCKAAMPIVGVVSAYVGIRIFASLLRLLGRRRLVRKLAWEQLEGELRLPIDVEWIPGRGGWLEPKHHQGRYEKLREDMIGRVKKLKIVKSEFSLEGLKADPTGLRGVGKGIKEILGIREGLPTGGKITSQDVAHIAKTLSKVDNIISCGGSN